MDTYRTVHKPHNFTTIFIRPEVYGYIFDRTEYSKEDLDSKFKNFKVRNCDKKNLLGNHTYFNHNY